MRLQHAFVHIEYSQIFLVLKKDQDFLLKKMNGFLDCWRRPREELACCQGARNLKIVLGINFLLNSYFNLLGNRFGRIG